MTTDLLIGPYAGTPENLDRPTTASVGDRPSARQRWTLRRREAGLARAAGAARERAAGMAGAAATLGRAAELLEAGWVQGAWFHVRLGSGQQRAVGPLDLSLLGAAPVTGACLVGAVVQAGGATHAGTADAGPAGTAGAGTDAVTSRALDVLWDTLQDCLGVSVRRASGRACPPAERTLRVRELTRWNDDPRRTPGEVAGLVAAARRRALCEAAAHAPHAQHAPHPSYAG